MYPTDTVTLPQAYTYRTNSDKGKHIRQTVTVPQSPTHQTDSCTVTKHGIYSGGTNLDNWKLASVAACARLVTEKMPANYSDA